MRRDSNPGLPPNPNFTIRSQQQHTGEYHGGYKGNSQNNFDDGDNSSQKSKPFRIKEMGKDHMNTTGVSTTTSEPQVQGYLGEGAHACGEQGRAEWCGAMGFLVKDKARKVEFEEGKAAEGD